MSGESGPWSDYAKPDGPWSDYEPWPDYAKPDGLLPIDKARADFRKSWADELSRMRAQAEKMKMLPMYHKELERFGGERGALDYFSSDYFFGTTPLGKKYKEAGLLGEVTK